MPLSRQQLRVDQAGHEDAVRPRLRAAAFDRREPVTRRAAALETLFRADWERSASEVAPESGTHCRKLPSRPDRGRARPGARAGGSAHSPRCSVRLRRPPFGQVTERAPADSRPQLDGMLMEALVRACCCGKRPRLSSESVIETFWPKHEAKVDGIATDPAAWATNRIVRVGPGSANQKRWKTPADMSREGIQCHRRAVTATGAAPGGPGRTQSRPRGSASAGTGPDSNGSCRVAARAGWG